MRTQMHTAVIVHMTLCDCECACVWFYSVCVCVCVCVCMFVCERVSGSVNAFVCLSVSIVSMGVVCKSKWMCGSLR